MKVLSLFSGIGAFEKALDNLDVHYELAAYCEIDKYASRSYAAIHNVSEDLNLGDITKVDEKALPKDLDLITYGFPCQDISVAGRQKGLIDEDGNQTRSGLFFESLRIIKETQPRIAIAENVKNLTSKTFRKQFELVLKSLDEAGYNNYWKVLNLKDFGIPQNRERVFIVSIRKDIDNETFAFPAGFPLKLRLKDVLEDEVDEKYYLKGKASGHTAGVAAALRGRYNEDGKVVQHLEVSDREYANTITSVQKDSLVAVAEPSVLIYERNEYGKAIRKAYEAGEVKENWHSMKTPKPRTDGISNTLTTVQKDNYVLEPTMRIRNLTTKECFRLMGFDDRDHAKATAVNSKTRLYRQAGNSIGVPCVEHILKALFECGALSLAGDEHEQIRSQEGHL